ncbi:MAG: hypothetical protein IM574_13045 [Cytophagales bacterium]|jgi:hypothetical protein|nr:hypothetical protein [Cytophagales bacterium]MCA6387969.1 hypothetical protein [Cytophagales bacterium]MCA6393025.1 hypothetical protein [Cytophagales bacterium]MCA6427031.1 hypothetical protein [Cytophagales bacterium]MCA6428900.1 hypothetical protein [Cytophagales bacterium]
MTNEEKAALAEKLLKYCKKFNVPLEFLFEILEDQKVTPMIRGKAMEYNAFLLLEQILPRTTWSVQKLNLNAQTGTYDEDISITHRRTGVILKVESKSTVRGSISDGKRSRNLKVPHFLVKSHRSRSNIKLAGSSNDRYSVDSFDVLITNTSNAIFEGNTVGEHLEVVHDQELKSLLYNFYSASNDAELITACESDWRYCIPVDIAIEGFIPRTPYVKLESDINWKPLASIEQRLLQVVEEKRRSNQTTRRK